MRRLPSRIATFLFTDVEGVSVETDADEALGTTRGIEGERRVLG